jgi:hypothetical protein
VAPQGHILESGLRLEVGEPRFGVGDSLDEGFRGLSHLRGAPVPMHGTDRRGEGVLFLGRVKALFVHTTVPSRKERPEEEKEELPPALRGTVTLLENGRGGDFFNHDLVLAVALACWLGEEIGDAKPRVRWV